MNRSRQYCCENVISSIKQNLFKSGVVWYINKLWGNASVDLFPVLQHDLRMPRPELDIDFNPGEAHDSDGIGLIQVVDGSGPMGQAKYLCDLFLSAVSD